MDRIKKILTSKKFYAWVSGIITAGILFLILIDFWLMPAYTHYNEGVTLPDVTKVSLEEAVSILDQYGLRHEILDRRAHSAYPADYIIDQAPPARQIVKPDRKVYLTVNTAERPTVVVPDVVNMSLRNARIQLENYGLNIGTISYDSGRFRAVIRQSIPAGDTVDVETTIDLTVSDGLAGRMIRVPEVVGLSLPEAQQKILEEGLRVEIRFQPTRDFPPNTIIAREPEGPEIRESDTLTLIVSERFDLKEEVETGPVMSDTTATDTTDENLPDPNPQQENP